MTESAVVRYEPTQPVQSAANLKALLERNQESIAQLLPRHVTVERIIKTMLVAVNRQPKLLRCTQSSVFETIQRAAELGLDLSGTLGEAYPVPYKDTCQLIIGYRGLAKLTRQSGEIATIEAEPVYEGDHFVYQKGSEFRVEFRPKIDGERGNLRGFYSYVRTKDGGQYADYMTIGDVNRIRQRSRAKDDGPWVSDFAEMGRKTVFRRLAKWLPVSNEKLAQAIEQDNREFAPAEEVLGAAKIVTPKNNDPMEELAERSILSPVAAMPPPPAEPDPMVEETEEYPEPQWEEPVPMEVVAPIPKRAADAGYVAVQWSDPTPGEFDNGINVEQLRGMIRSQLGPSGMTLAKKFLKTRFGERRVTNLNADELAVFDKFISDTALRMAQESNG